MKSSSYIFSVILGGILLLGQLVEAQDPVQYGTPFTGVPDPEDAVIYQVNMRSFCTSRNFQGVSSRLDYIKNLGVNVIYLLPIHPIGTLKAFNSPFCVKDHLEVILNLAIFPICRTLSKKRIKGE